MNYRYDVHNMLIDNRKTIALQASIATFLRAKQQWPYCNDCIREEFPDAAVEDVARETASMHGQIGFLKDTGICTRCWQQKPVIRAM